LCGFLFCGMVEEPTCFFPKGSAISCISFLWRFRNS